MYNRQKIGSNTVNKPIFVGFICSSHYITLFRLWFGSLFQACGTQTCISCLKYVNTKLFNKYVHTENVKVTSLITENTMADDASPVYVDRFIQTHESGGFLADKKKQTEEYKNFNFQVYTDNCLSNTTRKDGLLSTSDSQTIIHDV